MDVRYKPLKRRVRRFWHGAFYETARKSFFGLGIICLTFLLTFALVPDIDKLPEWIFWGIIIISGIAGILEIIIILVFSRCYYCGSVYYGKSSLFPKKCDRCGRILR